MFLPAHQTITNELIDSIYKYSIDNIPSEFEFRSLFHKSEKVKKVKPDEGYMLEGMIYACKGDYNNSKQAFEKSLALCTKGFHIIVLNYSISLEILGKFNESYKVLEEYFEDTYEFNKHAFTITLHIGLLDKALSYYKKFKTFPSFNSNAKYLAYEHHLNTFKKSCDQLKISTDDLHKVHLLVLSSIDNEKTLPINISNTIDYESGNIILIFHVNANIDAESIAKISWDIVEKLAEEDIPAIISNKLIPIIKSGY